MASTNTSATTGDLSEDGRQPMLLTLSLGSGTHSEETAGDKDLRF